MSKLPWSDRQLVMALEACRPGSDDLSDPALQPAAERVAQDPALERRFQWLQKLDVAIAGALGDVPVPAGLRQRLLLQVVTVPAAEAAPRPAPQRGQSHFCGVLPQKSGQSPRRRTWLPSLAGVAVAAALLVAVSIQQRVASYTPGMVMEAAVESFQRDLARSDSQWREDAAPASFPASPAVRVPADWRWRRIEGLLQASGVAYQMRQQGVTAVLYVFHQPVSGLPDEPSLRPSTGTANCSTTAWQEGGLVYVLVVQGDWRDYQLFLDVPQGPLA